MYSYYNFLTLQSDVMGRKYLSMAEKAKRKKEASEQQQKLLQKMPKLTSFFVLPVPLHLLLAQLLMIMLLCWNFSSFAQVQVITSQNNKNQWKLISLATHQPIFPHTAAQFNDLGKWPLILIYEQKTAMGSKRQLRMSTHEEGLYQIIKIL